jgi:hypothetical protein
LERLRKKEYRKPGMVCMPAIPALKRLMQEDCEFEASLDFIVRTCLKEKKKKPHKAFNRAL